MKACFEDDCNDRSGGLTAEQLVLGVARLQGAKSETLETVGNADCVWFFLITRFLYFFIISSLSFFMFL